MNVYTESGAGNKLPALRNALKDFGWELCDMKFSINETPVQCTLEGTITAAIDRARRITVEDEFDKKLIPPGSLVVGIQKGWHVCDSTSFVVAVAAFIKGERVKPETAYAQVPANAPGIQTLVKNGMHVYEAFKKLKGVSIAAKEIPVYELLTGTCETAWMEKVIVEVLSAIQQKQKAIQS